MSDAVEKFWREWLALDYLHRSEKLQQLAKMGLSNFMLKSTMENEQMLRAFCNLWNSYFEDFYNVMQQEIEKKKMHPFERSSKGLQSSALHPAQLGTSVKKK